MSWYFTLVDNSLELEIGKDLSGNSVPSLGQYRQVLLHGVVFPGPVHKGGRLLPNALLHAVDRAAREGAVSSPQASYVYTTYSFHLNMFILLLRNFDCYNS